MRRADSLSTQEHLVNGEMRYLLLRTSQQYDGSAHVKFSFVYWLPDEGLRPLRRA